MEDNKEITELMEDQIREIHDRYLSADWEAFKLRLEVIELKSDLQARTESHDQLIQEVLKLSDQLINFNGGHQLLSVAMAQKSRYGRNK